MKESNSFGYVSLSAFLHGAAILGVTLLPVLSAVQTHKSGDVIEMTEIRGGTPAPTPMAMPAALPAPVAAPVVAKAEPKAEIIKKLSTAPAKPAKKVMNVDIAQESPEAKVDKPSAGLAEKSMEDSNQELEKDVAAAQASAEEFAKQQAGNFVTAPETMEERKAADPESEVIDTTVKSAAHAAVTQSAEKELAETATLEAPQTNAPVTRLGQIQSKTSGEGSAPIGSNDIGAVAGPTADDLRSYLDLKQQTGNRAPLYPQQARRQGWQGEVVLNYYVTSEGLVKDVRVAKSSGYAVLDQEAVRAISRFRYVKGQEGWASHPVVFSLKSNVARAMDPSGE